MSLFRVVKRQEPLGWGSFLVLAAAICLSLLLSGIILFIGGTSPLEGIIVLFKGAFGNRYALEDAILKATPIF
ncbi:MAG: ABC transporter permease, partial [Desulfofustis sp.]|nr:ABC transporter permease [Desulfofustis sp.]